MTVNNVSPTIRFEGNGATTQFFFSMSVPDASGIDVFVTDATGNIRQLTTLEYSVLMAPLIGTNPTPQGGSVIYNPGGTPLPAGQFLTIVRDLDPIQSVSLTNQSIIYPPVVEKEFDYLTMLTQQGGLDFGRAIKVPPADPFPADLPPKAARANQTAFFNANGDLVAGTPLDDTIMVSAAMQPVVAAATTQEAVALMGVYPDPKLITDSYVVIPDDNNRVIILQGNKYYLVTAADPTTYPVDYRLQVINNDPRAKLMNISGYTEQFILYPDQQVFVNRGPGGWVITRSGRWAPKVPTNLFVDPTLGSDNIAVADGLASGAGAFQTVLKATQILEQNLDGDFTINLSNGTHNMPAGGLILNKRLPGGSSYKLVGNVGTPGNVNIIAVAGTNGISVTDGAVLSVAGITFSGGAGSNSLFANRGGVINIIGDVLFGANGSGYNIILFGGVLNVDASYHVNTGASGAAHIGSFYNSQVTFGKTGGPTISVTLNGATGYTYWYICQVNATIVGITTITYVNGGFQASGTKASVAYNAVVNAGGVNVPGANPAEVSNGGFFF